MPRPILKSLATELKIESKDKKNSSELIKAEEKDSSQLSVKRINRINPSVMPGNTSSINNYIPANVSSQNTNNTININKVAINDENKSNQFCKNGAKKTMKQKTSSNGKSTERKVYRDFSRVSDDTVLSLTKNSTKTGRSRQQDSFPVKLHAIIERAEIDAYTSIISWLPHGRAFKIHSQEQFMNIIARKYFYFTLMKSFQRQINIYGFRKIWKGADKGAYCHELFLRGRP